MAVQCSYLELGKPHLLWGVLTEWQDAQSFGPAQLPSSGTAPQ
jgi:hypothetical protein